MTNKITSGTIARTIILALALINQTLVMFGKSPLNIADDDIATVVSLIFTIASTVIAWWKNNSFTKAAIEADLYKDELKK
jgi:SPP1 family holin